VQLKDQNNQIFYDKLKFVYLEMPHFDKQEHELVTRLDKWLYFIKHLEDFQNIPEIFKDEVFTQAFTKAEIAKYSTEERDEYEQSLKIYRDMKGVIDTAFDEGVAEGEIKGIVKGKIEIAKFMKAEGEPLEKIMRYTGLSAEEINQL
jgi:predicted transposase/invertase (TIGR01784 family)